MAAVVATVTVGFTAVPASASGAVTGVSGVSGVSGVLGGHTMNGQPIPCVAQSDGVRVCHGDESGLGRADLRLRSFDGTPLALYVTLPPAHASGAHGNHPLAHGHYPLVVQSHGWGAPPSGPNDTQYGGPTADQWASDGYAVLQLTARGWGDSCGSAASRLVNPAACANGFIHLDDYRYEARDVQHAVGLLVDEGIVNPNRIGVTGESYGAGVSLELATLKDRVMLQNGRLVPWRSPHGRHLHIAAAATFAGWSDLVYSLLPNGRTLDSRVTSATADLSPVGVEKQSINFGLYEEGAIEGYYAPPGVDPQADLTTWYANITAGEPYNTPADESTIQQIAQFRSPYYLLDGAYGTSREPPAPLFLANGFTDDIFPVDEALRYYNLERSLYPFDPISLFDFDGGHMRGQNKPADAALMVARIKAFLGHYVNGTGPRPTKGVTALTQTCPRSAPSGGPYHANTWAALHPGEVNYSSRGTQTILSTAGNPTISETFDPVFGGGACAAVPATDQGAGVATYRLPAATGSGYTLLGSPTVIADLNVTGKFAYIAARLLDVNPATNTETLVARGVYRIDPNAPDGRQVFQLHPGAWHFAAGHIPKLELLGQDPPYTRPSNGVFSISVSNLRLRLPVHERLRQAWGGQDADAGWQGLPDGGNRATPLENQPQDLKQAPPPVRATPSLGAPSTSTPTPTVPNAVAGYPDTAAGAESAATAFVNELVRALPSASQRQAVITAAAGQGATSGLVSEVNTDVIRLQESLGGELATSSFTLPSAPLTRQSSGRDRDRFDLKGTLTYSLSGTQQASVPMAVTVILTWDAPVNGWTVTDISKLATG